MNRLFILREQSNLNALNGFIGSNWQACVEQKKPLAIHISFFEAKRKKVQNSRYWAVLNTIAEQVFIGGKTFKSDTWHEQFKRQFIGVEELPHGGSIGISSASLSVEGFAEYSNKVELFAITQLNCEFNH